MAKARDGATRSDQRRMDDSFTVRCMSHKKLRATQTAERLGFSSLSAWIMDLIESEGNMSLRQRRVLAGKLGQIGAQMTALTSMTLSDAEKLKVGECIGGIAQIQNQLMAGLRDASQSD